MIQRQTGDFRWEGVDVHPYKEDGTHFKTITRQTLFKAEHDLPVEFRYFEVGEGGHSTLERHDHSHVVMIIRGSGEVLVADEVFDIGLHDLVKIPPKPGTSSAQPKGTSSAFSALSPPNEIVRKGPGPSNLKSFGKPMLWQNLFATKEK